MLHGGLKTLAYQAIRFLNPAESYCLLYLMGAVMFAGAVLIWRRRRRRAPASRAMLRYFGASRIWLHKSSWLDYRLYALHGVLLLAGYGLLEGSSELWRAGAFDALTRLFGPSRPPPIPPLVGAVATTVLQVLALELGYWACHYAFNKVPALWAVHKVHHSAEVMTPFTEWRQHPIEFVAFANVLTLSMGGTYGVVSYVFGPGAEPLTLFQLNILLVAHLLTFHHLRHTGVWIAARGWLGRVFHSPAHHQIHHSTDPRHFDRNLGYALSIWDWAFGTLYVPELRERLVFGLGAKEPAHRGVVDALLRPLGLSRV